MHYGTTVIPRDSSVRYALPHNAMSTTTKMIMMATVPCGALCLLSLFNGNLLKTHSLIIGRKSAAMSSPETPNG